MWGNINELYSIILIHFGKTCFNLFIIPIVLEHLFAILSICLRQFKCVSNIKPKKLKCWILSMFTPSIVSVGTITFLFVLFNKSYINFVDI